MLMDLGNFSEFCPSRQGRNMGRNGELAPGPPCREVRNMVESECCPNLYGVPTARGIFVGLCFFYLHVVPGTCIHYRIFCLSSFEFHGESFYQISIAMVCSWSFKISQNFARPVRDEIWVGTKECSNPKRAVRYGMCKIPYVVTIYMAFLRHAEFLWGLCFFYPHVVPPGQVWKLKTRYLSESVFQIDTLKVTDKIEPDNNARPVRDEIWVGTGECSNARRAVRYGIWRNRNVALICMAYLRHAEFLWVCVFSTHMMFLRDMYPLSDFGSLIL